jgi:GNAT superfamily N-acetyltransferase
MRIERFDPTADTEKIRACYDLYAAGHPIDDPDGPPMSLPGFSCWFSTGWDSNPRETWLVPGDEDGTWAGAYLLEVPARENTHLARLVIFVAPARRRTGLGTALLRHAAGRAADLGRTLLSGMTREGAPGSAFAAAVGARPGVTEVRRVLDLADIPAAHLGALRHQAESAAKGYSLVSWQGPSPEEYIDQVAVVVNALADAPHDPGEEPEIADADRVRDSEKLSAAQGLRFYTVVARHDDTGELAGFTRLGVDQLIPDWGFQQLTAVIRTHRGHRLGLLVKVAMMDLLAGAEPGLERIVTGNADANSHMIAINAELGFRVLDKWPGWQLDVAQVACAPVAPPPPA